MRMIYYDHITEMFEDKPLSRFEIDHLSNFNRLTIWMGQNNPNKIVKRQNMILVSGKNAEEYKTTRNYLFMLNVNIEKYKNNIKLFELDNAEYFI